jgi:uncharacterized membrane protein YgdD (TMEM256/DUF423 family)
MGRMEAIGRLWIGLGSIIGLGAVAMAAAAAHALPNNLDAASLEMVRSALQMQGWHAPALLFTGLWAPRGGIAAHLAGAAFVAGLLLFCGAVYALALFGLRLPAVAPVGGTLLMLGWLLLGLSALRRGGERAQYRSHPDE